MVYAHLRVFEAKISAYLSRSTIRRDSMVEPGGAGGNGGIAAVSGHPHPKNGGNGGNGHPPLRKW